MKQPITQSHAPKVRELIEVQDRQYDPGHWTGGRIDPLLRGRRPNRYGYVLLFNSLIGLGLAAAGFSDQRWMMAFGGLAVAALFIVAGVKLLRGSRGAAKRRRS